jgi:hypothetical protein
VDQPGTYYVAQQYHSQCYTGSVDSLKIFFDSACAILDANLTSFSAVGRNNKAELDWKVSEDSRPTHYDVEYSTDNRYFRVASTLNSEGKPNISLYHFTHLWDRNSATIFYRIKITSSSGTVKYSKVIPVSFRTRENIPLVYPNPSNGDTWVSLNAGDRQTVFINIFDSQGRQISREAKEINTGSNTLRLSGLENAQKGIYFIKIKTADSESTQSLILR